MKESEFSAGESPVLPLDDAMADHLISRYIVPSTERTPEDARLTERGVPIWVIVANLDAYDGAIERVASDFAISCDAVLGAMAFYDRHREQIDAHIAYNSAAFS